MKMVEIDKIRKFTKEIYEKSNEIKFLQEKLEDMLSAIDKINLDYNRGKIPKEIFDTDNKKLREQSILLIKKINKMVNDNLNNIKIITGETLNDEVKKKIKKKRKIIRKKREKIEIFLKKEKLKKIKLKRKIEEIQNLEIKDLKSRK